MFRSRSRIGRGHSLPSRNESSPPAQFSTPPGHSATTRLLDDGPRRLEVEDELRQFATRRIQTRGGAFESREAHPKSRYAHAESRKYPAASGASRASRELWLYGRFLRVCPGLLRVAGRVLLVARDRALPEGTLILDPIRLETGILDLLPGADLQGRERVENRPAAVSPCSKPPAWCRSPSPHGRLTSGYNTPPLSREA